MKITKGKQQRPQKVVIYGPEGIGKSTLASYFPAPVFVDVEGGTAQLDVARIDGINDWQALLAGVSELAGYDECKTLVIDTADWAEKMCAEAVCADAKKSSIEDFGYGKGYTYLLEKFAKLLEILNCCIDHNKNVVFLAHAKMRKFEEPDEMGAYDRWELKLSKQVAPMLKEWADMVLFLNYQTVVVSTKEGKKKATGGKRVIYTSHHPCWDAKNRFGLPEELPLEWSGPLANIFTVGAPSTVAQAEAAFGASVQSTSAQEVKKLTPAETVLRLIANAKLNEGDVIEVLTKCGMCGANATIQSLDENTLEVIINNWDQLKEQVEIPF